MVPGPWARLAGTGSWAAHGAHLGDLKTQRGGEILRGQAATLEGSAGEAAAASSMGLSRVIVLAQPLAGSAVKGVPASPAKPAGGIKDDDAKATAIGSTSLEEAGLSALTALTALSGRSGYSVPIDMAAMTTQVAGGPKVVIPSKSSGAAAEMPVAVGAKRPAPEGAESTEEEGVLKKRKKRIYPCEICGVILKSFGGYSGHMLGHSGEKPYSCKVCQKAFRHVNALRNHELIHSGIKPYKCDQCDKCFVEQGQLKNHRLVHSDLKPHVCNEAGCDFKTRTAGNLREHQRTHSEDRKLACTKCDKKFKQHSVLNTHMLTHTGERPHKCEECGQGFIKSYNLKRHIEVHHGKDKKRSLLEEGIDAMATKADGGGKKSSRKAAKKALSAAAVVSAPSSRPSSSSSTLALRALVVTEPTSSAANKSERIATTKPAPDGSKAATARGMVHGRVASPETDAADILASAKSPSKDKPVSAMVTKKMVSKTGGGAAK